MRMKREQNQSQVWFSEVGDKCHLLSCFSSMFVCGSVRVCVHVRTYVRACVCERVCVCLSVCHLVLQSPLQCTASAAASSSLHLPFTSIRPFKNPSAPTYLPPPPSPSPPTSQLRTLFVLMEFSAHLFSAWTGRVSRECG